MERKLLLVDDDESSLKTLVRYLEKRDYEVLTAHDCGGAFRILENQTINVVISDYRMPVMNGIDFLKEVGKFQPDTVRIMISGYIELNLLIDSFNDGIILKFIPKPWIDYNIKKIISDSFDIYDQKKYFKKITSQSYQDMEMIFKLLPAAVVVFDRSGSIVSINKSASALFGSLDLNLDSFTGMIQSSENSGDNLLFMKFQGSKYKVKQFSTENNVSGYMLLDY